MIPLINKVISKSSEWMLTSGLRILLILLVLWVFLKIVKMIGNRILHMVEDDDPKTRSDIEKRADTLVGLMNGAARAIAVLVLVFVLLKEFGVDVTPLLAGAGIVGIAIAFGAQSIVKDIFYGFFILFENQFRVGDVIKISDITGTVEKINLRTTILRDVAGTMHVIPNGNITTVSNMTFKWSNAVIDIGVSYDANLVKVMDVMKRVGIELKAESADGWFVLDEPQVLGIETFGDSAVNLRVVIKTRPKHQWDVAREYRKRLLASFSAEGIEIPYPQMVVHKPQPEQN